MNGVLWVVELDYSHRGDWQPWCWHKNRAAARREVKRQRAMAKQPWRIRKYVRQEPKR